MKILDNGYEERKVILPNKIITLLSREYENEIDMDEILKIDYGNILGEILTFPVLLNRLGLLLSEIENINRELEFKIDLKKKELKKELAKVEKRVYFKLKADGINSPTKPQIEGESILDQGIISLEKEISDMEFDLLDYKKNRDDLNSLYWSAKAKDDKLNKISEKLRPTEFEGEIIDSTINGVLIKISKVSKD